MDLISLMFYKLVDGEDYIVVVDHSSCIDEEEALYRAQCRLISEGYIITKVDFPQIQCYKFSQKEEE